MTDHDEIAALLKKMPPVEPDKEARHQAIDLAMAAFDQKFSSRRQGMHLLARLTDTIRIVRNASIGDWNMKPVYAIVGGLCLGAIGLTLMNSTALFDFAPRTQALKAERGIGMDGAVAKPSRQVAQFGVAPSPAPAMATANSETSAIALPQVAAPAAKRAAPMADMAAGSMQAYAPPPVMMEESNRLVLPQADQDKFKASDSNPLKIVKAEPVSTFSVDVDTASYSFVRSSLNHNQLPPKDAVRVEELVNYFPYHYEAPADREVPFKATTSVFPTPWNKGTKLLHVGIKGYEIGQKTKPHSNLVFLLDTSGSMYDANKLPLVQSSLKLLLETLSPDDTIAIVTYAGSSGIALEPTKVKDKAKILAALDGLAAGGATAGAEGIQSAYRLAEQHFDKDGVNRVILATDGDFNVGITDEDALKRLIEKKCESGIFLSVLGFGRGNYNDALMQVLAQNGNGNASYIDNLNEARKVLVDEASATLFPIAKDVKIQVEFNPSAVAEYRLIGYETRILNREDFNNDKVDAGDIGAGHTVTALYEITPVGSSSTLVDDLRYQTAEKPAGAKGDADEYAFVKIRYKLPQGRVSRLITQPVKVKDTIVSLDQAPQEARFASAVAAFGQKLRDESYIGDFSYDAIAALANQAKGEDTFGYRSEFIQLVRLAKTIAMIEPGQGKIQPPPIPEPPVIR